jgi:PKD repeat protein
MSVSITASTNSGSAPLRVHFTGAGWASSYVDSCQWDFGDGSHATGIDVYHEYLSPGTYTVTFAATTSLQFGAETATALITVTRSYVIWKTDLCYRLGLGVELQGKGPSEYSGDFFPFPPIRCGGVECVDDEDQSHQLIFDNAHGAWVELGMPTGPDGSGLARKWTDDDCSDGQDAVAVTDEEIAGSIELPEISGENEHFQVEGLESYYYFRPIDPDARVAAGYTREGQRVDQKITISLYLDGSTVPNDQAVGVPIAGKMVFKSAKQGRRARVVIDFGTSEFVMTGYTQYWKVSDVDVPPGYNGADQ